jgi:hypothetical protein
VSQTRPRAKVIVFGIAFFYPLAGVTYQFLHYLLGLQRLGFEVYYVEDSLRQVYDPRLNDQNEDPTGNLALIGPILDRFGMAGRWAYRDHYNDGNTYGMSEAALLDLYRGADAALNVTGAQEITDEIRQIPKLIYVESDPFSSQVKLHNGDRHWIDLIGSHDLHFSFGENIGQPDCDTPTAGYTWLPTRQPVAIDLWEHDGNGPAEAFTTVTTWRNRGKDVTYRGEKYHWTKHLEFERFLDLPALRATPFEMAVNGEPQVFELLTEHGWRTCAAAEVSQNMHTYSAYIQRSRGEFTVARDQYVRPRTGWFSDRSACYLAAGRPVITQDTAFGKFLPTGEGLFAFTTQDDVLAAVDAINSDYGRHCRAARAIADEYFECTKVVGSLMRRAGLM